MKSPRALVSVVVTCFNQAHFLSEAIESVLAQTCPNVELIVVDDGSGDNTGEIAGRYAAVRYIRQVNQGLAAARNTGIAACRGECVVFLDSDDRLMPTAIEIGLKELSRRPECGFVAGSHRMIGFDGAPLWEHSPGPDEDNLYRALLRRNFIGMHAAVMYQRFVFEAVGTFDQTHRNTEDYDLYLRVARRCPIGVHPAIVAEYRRHGGNLSRDPGLLLRSSLRSLERQRDHAVTDPESFRAYQAGRRFVRGYYGAQLARFVEDRAVRRDWKAAAAGAITLLRHYPQVLWKSAGSSTASTAKRRRDGEVDLGELRRLQPISSACGYDRGVPVDRHYIEAFLASHSADIRGRVLEIGDSGYTRKFGGAQVHCVDVLNVERGDPSTTIVADLSQAGHIPSSTFDCIIATQTLQYVSNAEAAAQALHRILKPGGVLLLTAPGTISRISPDPWQARWNWGFTQSALLRLLQEAWQGGAAVVHTHGNVLAGVAVLHGLSSGELSADELSAVDPAFPVLLTARAVRKAAPAASVSPTRAHTNGRPIILMYHRIADLSPDPWGLSVTPAHFAEQLEVLSRQARCVPLGTLAGGDASRDGVAVTFDDGYADNAQQARPLLERWDVPATVFVASGCLGERQFWWDDLSRTIFDSDTLPRILSLDLGGRHYEWLLGNGGSAGADRWRGWRAWHDDPTPRHYLYRSLFEMFRMLPGAERLRALEELRRWSGVPAHVSEPGPLTMDEARVLGSCELIELGCHTRTHPMLSMLDHASQREEILGSKRDLQDLTDKEPTLFAYPYGHAAAYSDTTVDLVREAGFLTACANIEGIVAADSDRLQLPRFQVHDWNGEEFERKLRDWKHAGEPCL